MTLPPLHLDVKELSCRRGGRLVFPPLSFTLAPGEALLLTGRNGAGKSSLIGTLLGRVEAASGTIRLDGPEEHIGERTVAEMSHHVGHRDGLKATLTAHENLSLARTLLGDPDRTCDEARCEEARCEEALAAVGLAHARDIPVGYLSAGQKRRVALARLLVARRPLWLLDEPTAALDTGSQTLLTALLTAHLASGGLLVAATHAPIAVPNARELALGAPA